MRATAAAAARQHPAGAFFALVFVTSWGGGLALRSVLTAMGAAFGPLAALSLFPALIVSVAVIGLLLTLTVDGREGVRRLRARATTWRLGPWYALVLLPPACILLALTGLSAIDPVFAPGFFPVGFSFGIAAGLLEEVGWTGYALPALGVRRSWQSASVVIGVLWGLWHLPVIDFLGAATPHRAWLAAFALSFVLMVSALRVIISWAAIRTGSLVIAQLVHISSTGCLVMFGPPRVSPAQEACWYASYGLLLWIAATVILLRANRKNGDRPSVPAAQRS
jgi:membrane protease YdiL (CAAX protease family)